MKKDILRLMVAMLIMGVVSCAVPDSRSPQFVVDETAKMMNRKIETAHYITEEEEPSEEQTEEVTEVIEEETPEEITPFDYIEEDEEPVTYEEDYTQPPGLIPIGTYEITAYEWTGNPCANGNYPTEGYTVACNDLPLGTEVYIDGVGYRVVEDRGGGGYGWMDLYLGDVESCYQWGRQYREVYIYG